MHTMKAQFKKYDLRDKINPLAGKCNAAAVRLNDKPYSVGKLKFIGFAGACVDLPTQMFVGELRFADCTAADDGVPMADFGPLFGPTAPEAKPVARLPQAKKVVKPAMEDDSDGN